MTAILCALAFACGDRFSGGPWVSRWGLPGRPVAYALLGLLIAAVVTPVTLAMVLVWAAWRWPSWDLVVRGRAWLPRSSMTPADKDELAETFLRHALPLLLYPWSPWVVAFPFIATGLGYWLGREATQGRDRTQAVELIRGFSFGVLATL